MNMSDKNRLAKQGVEFSVRCMVLLFAFFSFYGCEAPHLNPLDPENPENHYHWLTGQIRTFSVPRVPLKNVSVIWPVQEIYALSDTGGFYSIETTGAQDDWIFFDKPGYFSDSAFVAWENQKSIYIDVFLNARPSLDSIKLYTTVLHRYPSLQTEQTVLELMITDPDNDIDTVEALIPVTLKPLAIPYHTTLKLYTRTFSVFELEVERLDNLVGYPFYLSVRDQFDHVSIFELGAITRVIGDEVHFRAPSGNEITSPNPTLSWDKFNPGFEFTFTLEIYTAELTPLLQWRKEQIGMSISSWMVETPLPEGPYYWVIWAVDSFGNRTRSKPASFTVEAVAD